MNWETTMKIVDYETFLIFLEAWEGELARPRARSCFRPLIIPWENWERAPSFWTVTPSHDS